MTGSSFFTGGALLQPPKDEDQKTTLLTLINVDPVVLKKVYPGVARANS